MKFTFNRQALLSILNTINPILKAEQEFVLVEINNDTAVITGGNSDIELTCTIPVVAEFETPVRQTAFTLPNKRLLDLLRNSKDEEVTFIQNTMILVQLGGGRFKLQTFDPNNYPKFIMDGKEAKTFSIRPDLFLDAITKVRPSMAKNDVRYYLNGVKVELTPEKITVVGTDGHRLAVNEQAKAEDCTHPENDFGFILPKTAVDRIATLLKNEKLTMDVTVTDSAFKMDLDGLSMTTKLIDGRYPDYRRVFPKTINYNVKVDRLELKSLLQRALALSDQKLFSASFSFKDDILTIESTNNTTQESTKEEIACEMSQKSEIRIGFNIHYILDVLNTIADDNVIFSLNDNSSSALIRGEEDIISIFIVMPVRL